MRTPSELSQPLLLFLVVAGVLLVFIVLQVRFGWVVGLAVMGRVSGAPIPPARLLRLGRGPARDVALAYIRLVKGGLDVRSEQLEAHARAGGRVALVTSALLDARRRRVPYTWSEATADDLAGRDPVQIVSERSGPAADAR